MRNLSPGEEANWKKGMPKQSYIESKILIISW